MPVDLQGTRMACHISCRRHHLQFRDRCEQNVIVIVEGVVSKELFAIAGEALHKRTSFSL